MSRRGWIIGLLSVVLVAAVAGCGDDEDQAGSERGGPLEGRWTLVELGSGDSARDLPSGVSIDALFAGGSISGKAAINTYRGPFAADGAEGGLSIGPLATTQMAGPPEATEIEAAYLAALEDTASYSSDGEALTLRSATGDQLLAYEKSDQSIVGSWEVTGYNNGKEAVVSVVSGSTITAAFGQDLTLTGDSGVNTYRTTYTTSEGAPGTTDISISPPAGTLKAGPPELMEQEQRYLRALESAATYTLQGDALVLRDDSDAIAVTMSR